jgi:hypothetical protein
MSKMSDEIAVLDSVTKLGPSDAKRVVVVASHGGIYAAYVAVCRGARGVVLNDAGRGKDDAGISGLDYLDAFSVPAATVSYLSSRIGDGADMMERGRISHVNRTASVLGCAIGQSCGECAAHMSKHAYEPVEVPTRSESRYVLRASPDGPVVWGLDSISLIESSDERSVVIAGSHGELLGGRPETAMRYDAVAAVFHDAGIGIDEAGTGRLPVLDLRRIPAATVSAATARIGDARSIWETGRISRINDTAASFGAEVGMSAQEWVDTIIGGTSL